MNHDLTARDRLLPPSARSAARPGGKPPKPPFRWARRLAGALAGLVLVVCAMGAIAGYAAYKHYAADLPGVDGLKSYHPHVESRVYASDGSLMAELATERRIFAPYSDIPDLVKSAFISAEDQNFWQHRGVDPVAIMRAGVTDLANMGRGRRPIGASTITQQVAKNMLLGSEVTLTRKIKEALLALRIESVLTKQQILELYLNQIYLGEQSYGVAAAAQAYFGKTLDQLDPAQAAYLASLPKAPNNYNPYRFPDAALARRNWVLDRMAADQVITPAQLARAKSEPIISADFIKPPLVEASSYFAEDVRRQLVAHFGADATVQNGLMVRTSLDPALQAVAERVLHKGLLDYDHKYGGWRGPVTHLPEIKGDAWQSALAHVSRPGGMLDEWQLAVVLSETSGSAELGWLDQPPRQGTVMPPPVPGRVTLYIADLGWARPVHEGHMGGTPSRMAEVMQPGDVVMIERGGDAPASTPPPVHARHPLAAPTLYQHALLRQIPAIEGSLVTLDPRSGRVLALAGGWSFGRSQFDRVTQASRQPGSSFKPFVYLTAMQQNILPTQTFLDAPFVMNMGSQGIWRPQDYETGFEGPVSLRTALEKSLNLVTLRVADHVGMDQVVQNAINFHVADSMPKYLPGAIGAVDTTIMRMAGAYAALDEGGREVQPSLIDSVQDRDGHVVWRNAPVSCTGCDGTDPGQPPTLSDDRRQIADPQSTFQVVQMMKGVVERGTGVPAGQGLQWPIAGKTGTTQDFNDAWFIGFTPDLVTAVWMGYDNPASLGEGDTGGKVAAPLFHDFMAETLQGHPVLPFAPPEGMFMVANPAGGQDAFKAEEDPNASIQLASDPHDGGGGDDGTDPSAAATPTSGPPPASTTIDTNVGGVY